MNLLLVIGGLALLVAGGEVLIRGSVGLAERFGLSRALIGVLLLGFGTSMPEFVATFGAAAKDADDIAFGNVLGSNIANILMILGLSALILPIATQMRDVRRDAAFVLFSSAGCLTWIVMGGIPGWGATALVLAFLTYLALSIRADLALPAEPPDAAQPSRALIVDVAMVLIGIALLVLGAEGLIRGASAIARSFGISEALIGITVVGIGTSLPEATASILASIKRENTLAFANIVGSNIFNGLAILGVTGLVFPLSFDVSAAGFSLIDGLVLMGATLMMFVFAVTHRKVVRWEAALMLTGYIVYLGWLISRAI
ncbi:calcium/sodium antiporter [Algimonas porphyrae]|uniref:Sodium:calcium antiporter n=1 Tax=Algimonas porphyrae TaxID=1128113 RepID=A0ABQ5V3M5_9PROT|nr:calcium/sodium antiporter [Algimonas porphyrae]GLQ21329.1 sodium:calcium antiporter [Algimonas porphyrae]